MKKERIMSMSGNDTIPATAHLENVNNSVKSTVQTLFTTQSSNGCQVTVQFAEQQDSEIECAVANM